MNETIPILILTKSLNFILNSYFSFLHYRAWSYCNLSLVFHICLTLWLLLSSTLWLKWDFLEVWGLDKHKSIQRANVKYSILSIFFHHRKLLWKFSNKLFSEYYIFVIYVYMIGIESKCYNLNYQNCHM